MPDLVTLLSFLRLALKDRQQLVLESIALRHQLAVGNVATRAVDLPSASIWAAGTYNFRCWFADGSGWRGVQPLGWPFGDVRPVGESSGQLR